MIQATLDLEYEQMETTPENVLINFLSKLNSIFKNYKDEKEIKENLINLYFESIINLIKVILKKYSLDLKYENMNKPEFLTPLIFLQLTFFYKTIVEKEIYFSQDDIKNYLNNYLNNNLVDNNFIQSIEEIFKCSERFPTKLRLLNIVCVLFSVLYEIDIKRNDVNIIVNEIFRRFDIEKKKKVKEEVKIFISLLMVKDNRFKFLKEYFKIID